MRQTKLFNEEREDFQIGDLVRITNPISDYEGKQIFKIVSFTNDDFAGLRNVKVKKSHYHILIKNIEKI